MSIVEELKNQKTRNRLEALEAYRGILHRAATAAPSETGEAIPADIAMLGELLPILGRSETDFAQDLGNFKVYLQAMENLAAVPADDPEAAEAAWRKKNEAFEAVQAAQIAFSAATAAHNNIAFSHQYRREMCQGAVASAKDALGEILPSWRPPAPEPQMRSEVQYGVPRQIN